MKMKKKMPFWLKILILFLIVFMLNFGILGFLVHKGVISQSQLPVVTIIVGLLDFFILGFLLGNHVGKKGIWVGLGCGLCLSLIFVLVALLGFENFSLKFVLKLIIFTLASGLGGAFGVNLKRII